MNTETPDTKRWLRAIRRLNNPGGYDDLSTEQLADEVEDVLSHILDCRIVDVRYYIQNGDEVGIGQEGIVEFIERLQRYFPATNIPIYATKVPKEDEELTDEYWVGDVTPRGKIWCGDNAFCELWKRVKDAGQTEAVTV